MNISRRERDNFEIEDQSISGQLNSSVSFSSNTMEVEESTVNPSMLTVGYRTVKNILFWKEN